LVQTHIKNAVLDNAMIGNHASFDGILPASVLGFCFRMHQRFHGFNVFLNLETLLK
jgi:hypothetical protein